MKKTSLILLAGTFICVLSLVLLVKLTGMPNEQKNGFTRIWIPEPVFPLRDAKITAPLENISGATRHHIFFTVPNPAWLVMMDQSLDQQDTISFPVPASEQLAGNRYTIVDSPWIYLHANNIPALLSARFDGGGHIKTRKLATTLFTRSVQISPTCMVVRAFDSSRQIQVFQQIDCLSGKVTLSAPIVEQPAGDIGFSTDGMLRYDSLTHHLLYIQFYRNRFFCLDSNLHVLYTAKTIDTIRYNSISIQKVRVGQQDRLMPAAARTIVNDQSCAEQGRLYILSGLVADNEDPVHFRHNATIDCYAISNGNYLGSFHIPYFDGEKLQSFWVKEDRLIALYKDHLSVFSLHFP